MLQRKQWGHGGDALLGQRLRLVHNGQVLCERGVVGLLHQHEVHQVLQQRRWGGGVGERRPGRDLKVIGPGPCMPCSVEESLLAGGGGDKQH